MANYPTGASGANLDLLKQFLPFLTGAATGGGSFLSQNAGTMGLGLLQTVPSLINLIRLSREQRPNYQIAPEQQQAYNLAQRRSQFGFMPQQIGAFNQNLAQAQATDFYNARNMAGGGLAQALSGAMAGRRLGSLNQFAGQDAAQQAQNVNALYGQAGAMQRQRNLATQQDIAYRMAKEQAAGQGLKAGLTNIASGINANQALGLGNRSMMGQDSQNQTATYAGNAPWQAPMAPPSDFSMVNPEGTFSAKPQSPTRQPFGGGLWNPYAPFNASPNPYAYPSMLSTGQ
jgi:hypothetical protein